MYVKPGFWLHQKYLATLFSPSYKQQAEKGTPYAFLDAHLMSMADAANLPRRKVRRIVE